MFLVQNTSALKHIFSWNKMVKHTGTKVLIIGGGPAGLALAQILQANNVSCTVFERDDQIDARAQGWAVALTE